jgi:hypothetical protein
MRQGLDRSQQRDLGVEGLAGPRDERGRNAKGDVVLSPHEEGGARCVPCSVATGLECRPQTTRRKARGVRLTLHQLRAGEVEHHTSIAIGPSKTIVLLGRQSREWLEPVGVVTRSVLDRPVLHRGSHYVRNGRVEWLSMIDGTKEASVHLLGKPLPHDGAGEYVCTENAIDAFGGNGPAIQRTYRGGHRNSCLVRRGCRRMVDRRHCYAIAVGAARTSSKSEISGSANSV